MAFTDDFAEALGELDTDPDLVQSTFTWADNPYPCFASGATKGAKLEDFGYAVNADIVVVVRGGLFGDTRPARGQEFSVAGKFYRIDMILTAPNAAFLRIAGVSPSKGA